MTPGPETPTWDHPRGTAAARLMVELGAERGLDITDLLAGTRLDEQYLADPESELEAGQELAVARNLARLLGGPPGLGVDVGKRYRVGHLGIWGYAMLSSPTLRELVRLGVRYTDLSFAFITPSYEEDAHEGRVVLGDNEIPADIRTFFVEREITKLATLMPVILGPRHAEVRYETSLTGREAMALREGLPHLRLSSECRRHILAFDRAMLDAPLQQADPITAHMLEQQCAALLQTRRRRRGVADHVRSLILARIDDCPGMDDIAAQLHVDPRTLRRQLLAEGTSFRELVDEVRSTLADELLGAAGLSVHDVARRLGYHDAAGFSRAYRRWNGTNPGGHRQPLTSSPQRTAR